MIRLRSTKLLSGVSAVAVITALATAAPALASQTFTGPDLFSPYTNNQTDFVLITTDAVMNSDGVVDPEDGNSFINAIAMSGAGDKLAIDDSALLGGILNTGSMVSTDADGIDIRNDSIVVGTINNQGLIQGGTGNSGIELNDSVLVGGIFNGKGATITGAANGIYILNDSTFVGGISNEGAITGSGGDGIQMSGANVDFIGGIRNFESGVITGNGAASAAIDIGFPVATSSFIGNIENDGTIQGLGGGTGIYINTGAFTGDILNNTGALIQATSTSATAIGIVGGTFTGNLTNSGRILATGSSSYGVILNGTTVFVGNITNNASAQIRAALTALGVGGTSFTGNVSNSGLIQSDSGTAVDISTGAFTGNLSNSSSGSIAGSAAGVNISATAFTGNFTNDGSITASSGTGVNVAAATFTGNISNNSTGSIYGSAIGLRLGGTSINGNATNDGDITGGTGLRLATGATLTGAITNNEYINGTTADGVHIEGTLTGALTNNGVIEGSDSAIQVDGTVGSIANSGTLTGAQAIDLRLADAATPITQTDGEMNGDLRLDQTGAEFDDTFNANGGELRGNIYGGGGDDMAVAGDFAYVSGTADGLDQVTVNSGTAVFGSTGVGTDGAGVTFTNTNALTVNGGTAYLDDDTTIDLNNDLTVGANGRLAYFLTSDTATHGQINAGGNANLDGTLHAVIDGTSFASIGGDTFTYVDIITGTVSGTFSDVTTNSLFFEADAIYNGGSVDLELTRLGFSDVLTLGNLTRNQAAVGGTLETIYNNAGYGSDFEDLFNYLLSLPAGSEGEVTAIYDELGGAEHAQVQQAVLRASAPFDMAVGERLDEAKLALRGTGWAQNGERRYADAAQQRVMNDAAPAGGNSGLLRGSTGVSIWGRGYGDWTDVSGDDEAPGYTQDAGGLVGGVDFAIGENAVVGGAFGWATSSLDFDGARDHADIDSFEFGGYGSYGFGRFYADAQLSFSFHDVSSTRELDLGYDTFIAGANYNSRAWTLAGEVGTVFKLGKLNMQPMVGVNYTGASTDGFIEAGAGDFGLLVADSDADSLTSTVGLRMSAMWTVGGTKLVPDAAIAWRHEFADDRQGFTAAFLEDPSTPFNIISSAISPDSALVNAGLTAGVSNNLELFVDYNGVINSDANSHNGSAGFRATW